MRFQTETISDRELLFLVETEAAIVSVRALRTRYDVRRRTLLSAALFALVAVAGSPAQAQTAPPVPTLPLAAQPSAPADIIQDDGRRTPSAPSTQPNPQPRIGDRGVIVPPPSADLGLKMPPPSGGAMPVIPPPITPGGNQRVRPL